jgi:hypothetical protein
MNRQSSKWAALRAGTPSREESMGIKSDAAILKAVSRSVTLDLERVPPSESILAENC